MKFQHWETEQPDASDYERPAKKITSHLDAAIQSLEDARNHLFISGNKHLLLLDTSLIADALYRLRQHRRLLPQAVLDAVEAHQSSKPVTPPKGSTNNADQQTEER